MERRGKFWIWIKIVRRYTIVRRRSRRNHEGSCSEWELRIRESRRRGQSSSDIAMRSSGVPNCLEFKGKLRNLEPCGLWLYSIVKRSSIIIMKQRSEAPEKELNKVRMGREEPKDQELRVTSNTKKDWELIRYVGESLVLQQGAVSFTARKKEGQGALQICWGELSSTTGSCELHCQEKGRTYTTQGALQICLGELSFTTGCHELHYQEKGRTGS